MRTHRSDTSLTQGQEMRTYQSDTGLTQGRKKRTYQSDRSDTRGEKSAGHYRHKPGTRKRKLHRHKSNTSQTQVKHKSNTSKRNRNSPTRHKLLSDTNLTQTKGKPTGGGGTTGRTGHKERETLSARHKSNTRENQQSDNEKENPPKNSNSHVQVLREGTFAEGKV